MLIFRKDKKVDSVLNETKYIMKKYSISANKSLGQNFLIDDEVVNNIIESAKISKNDLVIEIGPGAGSLTSKLAVFAKNVLCYEVDEALKPVLSHSLKDFNNIEIIFNDFLKSDVNNDIKKYSYNKLYVIANLPYYITTPILMKLITDNIEVDKIVVMVQKEVGDRFRAKPNTKDYSSLSVYLNYYFDVKKILDVSRNVFLPKPNVDSIVVEFTKKEQVELKNKELFFNLVRDSFKQKRKNLRNNLKNYDLNKIDEILKEHNMDLTYRAEQIPIEMFIEISNKL